MIFRQFYLNCLAHASYLIGDEDTKTAAVVDPQRDIAIYLDEAAKTGLTIRHVFLTHFHADFVAGHLELRDRTGATIHLGSAAHAEYSFAPMKDGDAVEFGRVRLQTIETPGHTVESISILVFDRASSDTVPYAVLTGDTLFIGDVGRPDLRASLGWSAATLGRMLYGSLRTKLLALPDSTLVYPTHGAGSLCGKQLSQETVSSIGEQRRTNYALQPMLEEDFVALVTADQPDAPAYFTYDAVLNSKERPTLEAVLAREMMPLSLDRVVALAHAGAQLLDVRDSNDFAQGHLVGSINIGLNGQYATWAGTLLDRERPIVIIAEPNRESEAAVRLGRIGFDQVVGYLDGGLQALAERPDLLGATERQSPAELAGALTAGRAGVIDVRTTNERRQKHIDGSVWIPLSQLSSRLHDLPPDRPLVVHCAGGYRSSIAASVLKQAGVPNVSELAGGLAAWEAAKLPLARG
jgi:rhodanese-related sulfurtransferase/glyoxylase-like metal-dependent hydrolase (beta-lactamase superfamily II)